MKPMNELLKLSLVFWSCWGVAYLIVPPTDLGTIVSVCFLLLFLTPGYRAGRDAVEKGRLHYLVGPTPNNRATPRDSFDGEISYHILASICWLACLAGVVRMPSESMPFFVLSFVGYLFTILGFYKGVVDAVHNARLASDPNDGPSGREEHPIG
jgi:hypothetical protein